MFVRRGEVETFWWSGLRIRDFTAGRVGSSSLAEVEVPPGACHPPAHSISSDKYYVVLGGTVVFAISGDEQVLGEGDAAIVPREIVFSYRNQTASTARLLLLHTPPFDAAGEILNVAE